MTDLHFSIDRPETIAAGQLVLKSSRPIALNSVASLGGLRQAAELILRQESNFQQRLHNMRSTPADRSFSTFHIAHGVVQEIFQLLAAAGALYCDNKKLLCDFFSKIELFYRIDNVGNPPYPITAMLRTSSQEFPLIACECVCPGSPPWFIKNSVLRLINSEISNKELRCGYTAPSELSLSELQYAHSDQDKPNGVKLQFAVPEVDHEAQDATATPSVPPPLEPLPLLILKDRSGAFADLWMVYPDGAGGTLRILYADGVLLLRNNKGAPIGKRHGKAEQQWEQDLLQTDFIKKAVGTTQYYCPMVEVAKSLTFLLEIGWQIEDWQARRLYRHTATEMVLAGVGGTIAIKGCVHYGDHHVDIKQFVGAFNRHDRFVQLGAHAIGLLPPSEELPAFNLLADEASFEGNGLSVPRNQLGRLAALFSSDISLSCDGEISALRQQLCGSQGIVHSAPGTSFAATLRPYQQAGVDWLAFLYRYGFHGLLADDMGLGKTVQLLAFLSQLNPTRPTLIILPTSLLFNWQREINRFLPEVNVILHHGPKRTTELPPLQNASIILTSYATVRLDLPLLSRLTYECVILDEAQQIKNHTTQTAQAVCRLQGRFRLSLTGTPLENHLSELWSHFHFLMPDLLSDERTFASATSSGDATFLQKVRQQVKPFILRRTKSQVAADLPPKIEQFVWVELAPPQRKVYDDFLSGFRGNLFKKIETDGISRHRLEVLEAILRLRQICCHPQLVISGVEELAPTASAKLEALLLDVETAIAEGSKLLIYSQFTNMLALIAKELRQRQWKYAYLDGKTKERDKAVDQFQNDPDTAIFLISLKTGSVGLNLTAADYVLIYDPWWNDAVENQAIDRAHRIGREGSVVAKRYIAIETIEEKIVKIKGHKQALIDSMLSGDFAAEQLSIDDLRYLLSSEVKEDPWG
jgi:superfamily II DNA or RNA helicase